MNKEIENIKEQLEEVIKKNLPERRDTCPLFGDFCLGTNCQHLKGYSIALSQINTSLIADEVLKVVVEKVEKMKLTREDEHFFLRYNKALTDVVNLIKQ